MSSKTAPRISAVVCAFAAFSILNHPEAAVLVGILAGLMWNF